MKPDNSDLVQVSNLEDYLKAVASHESKYITKVLGIEITVHPKNVMSPRYDYAPHFILSHLTKENIKDKKILEIGCGSGVNGVVLNKIGAKWITAIDINPYAVENTRENFAVHSVAGDVMLGDMFSPLANSKSRKFDVILFNAPYHAGHATSELEKGVNDPEYRAATTFLQNAHAYLEGDGVVYFGFSDTEGDYEFIARLITSSGLVVEWDRRELAYGISWQLIKLKIARTPLNLE